MIQKMIWLLLISFIFTSCEGKKSAEEYFTNAEVERNAKNIKASMVSLENLIKYYPENILAPKARYLIGDIYMNDIRDFQKAINSYTQVVENYPSSDQEAQAQFMVGYIQANILGEYEKAKISYSLFLEKFPDHELAPSVDFEIKNLGKDINDISVLKHITS